MVSIAVVGLLLLAAGCAGNGGRSGGTGGANRSVDRLDLLLTPVALDLDGRPGADGFGVRIYASNRRLASGVSIPAGRLEILLFDGVIRGDTLRTNAPLRTWAYAASELKPFAQKASIGISYRFALAWGDQKPRAERITVMARYVAPGGQEVYSAPGTIPLTVK